MIQFTIKTLDSRDHPFTVDDEITVQELKQTVMEEMGVDISLQRLIFCGRVLQDDKKLAEYGVEGKVIHMVQRAPPSVEAREALRERERERERENTFTNTPTIIPPEPIAMSPVILNNFTQQQIRRLVALATSAQGIQIEELPGLDLSPTASRLELLRRLITEIASQVEALKQNESDEQPNYPEEDPAPPAGTLAEACATNEVMCQIHQRPLVYQIEPPSGSTRQSRGRSIRAMRSSYHTPPADFGEIVEQLHNLDAEFAPFRELYVRTLRQVNNPQIQLEEEELQRRQRTAEISAELYHSFSHAYHLVSDIGLLMTHENSRLTSEALMRTPFPVQTHINVIQSSTTRRAPNEASSSSRAVPTSQRSQAQTQSNNQQTVNINVQPDPITYQVEIEARVPIPVNPDSQNQNQRQNQNQGQNQNQPQAQNQNNQSQGQIDQNQNNQDGQGNRRQVMLDFENLFRGMGQAGTLGGVEVVMSMEEIPQGAAAAMPQQDVGAGGPQLFGSQIYLAQMPWGGGPPTAELLQNILSSVIRQGLVPGMEGILHAHLQQIPNPNINVNQTAGHQNQNGQDQTANGNHGDHNADAQANSRQPGQGQGPGQSGSNKPGLNQAGMSQAGTSHAGTSQDGSGSKQDGSGQSGDNQANQGQGQDYGGNGVGEGSSNQGGSDSGGSGQGGSGQGGSAHGGPDDGSGQSGDNQANQGQGYGGNGAGEGSSGQGGSGPGGSGQGGPGQGGSGHGGPGQGGSGQDGSEQREPCWPKAWPECRNGQSQDDQNQPGQSQASQDQNNQNQPGSAQPQEQVNGGSSDPNQEEPPRPQSVSLLNLIYDRFLPCDSPHARRQLQRRREDTLRAGGPRLRDSSTSRIQNNVETLFERFDWNTINEESLMIAAFLTLREATAFSSGRTLVPAELLPLRRRLQHHMREIMQGDYEVGTQDQLAELIFARHAIFIARMQLITPIRPSVDLVESMKAVVLRFLNEAMTVLEMENNEMFSRRFRIVYPRMFYELCGVLSYCCLEGIEGLRRIYRSFISDLIQNIDEPVRDLLYSLAMENLNTAISRIETNKVHCAQFIRRKGSSQGDSSETSSETAMDIVDATFSQSEAMQRSLDDIEEFNPYPSESLPAGIVPTITTLVNGTSRTPPNTPTTIPIVPTVTTVPNVSTYQIPTRTHSVPIVPTAPITPTISMVSSTRTAPGTGSVPIVHTVPMVPTIFVRSPTPVSPIVPASPTIPSTPIPSLLSPQNIERSGAFAIASNSNQVQPSAAAYTRESTPIYTVPLPLHLHSIGCILAGDSLETAEMPEHSDHDSSSTSDMSHRSRPGRTSGHRPCPFVENYDDYWDGALYRGRRTRYSAPSTSSAPVHDIYGFDDSMSESQASASASTSRSSSRPYEPRGRYNLPRSSRPERSYDGHRGRRNATSTVTSTRSDRSYENRHNNASASSSSYRSDQSHHHTYRGYRGRRTHRGSNHPGTSRGSRSDVHGNLNGHNHYHFNGRHNSAHLAGRPERQLIGNSYGSIRNNHRNNHTNENNHNNPASPSSPPSPDDGSNLRFVPPAQIAQHWGEDWVPTFTRDLQRQSGSSEPYSDAYLSGMPPKKRRCVRQSRPPTTLDGLIGESVGEISEQLTSHSELRAAFKEHVRALARARAAADDEYEPARLAATARFLSQPRPSTQKSTEKQPSDNE